MSFWTDVTARLASLVHHERDEHDFEEELGFHLEMEARKLRATGLPAGEALRRARVALGGVEHTREAVRDARGVRWLRDAGADLRYAARQLARTPGFTAVAVATLALGIGVNTAIFSVVDGVLLRPVPFERADRLVMVWETDRSSGTTREPASWPDYVDFAAGARSLSGIAAFVGAPMNLTAGEAEPQRLTTIAATHGYFGLLGIHPLLGRSFTADEDRPGGANVVVLGSSLWRQRFGANRAIIGQSVRLDDSSYQVIGVAPDGADFALDQIHAQASYHAPYSIAGDVDAFIPLRASAEQLPRQTHPVLTIARLAPGATVASAQAELDGIATELERTYKENAQRGVHIEPLTDVVFGPVRPVLLLLMGAVVLVLLVACVNVANLLLARGTARAREVAVRGALGASLGRLSRQFVVEAVLLTLSGAAVGVALAYGGLHAMLALAPPDIPRAASAGIDLRVLGVTLAVSVLVGLAFSLVPTSQAFRVDIVGTIKGSGQGAADPRRKRFRDGLVVTELALSVMLVVCATLLVRSFWTVLQVNPGFRTEGVLKAEYELPDARYPSHDYSKWPNWVEIQRFNSTLLARVRAIPGVQAAAIANAHPLDAGFTNSFAVVGREAEAKTWPEISMRIVSAGYFETMGVPLRAGRLLSESDDASAPAVAVINDATATRFFPTASAALGNELRIWGTRWRVVGVVGDEHFKGLTEAAAPAVYVPVAHAPASSGVLLVRGAGSAVVLEKPVRDAIHALDGGLAVYGVEPLSTTLLASVGQRRFAMLVMGTFAAATLFLALIGVHGVLSYATAQRTREIGIRLALGATGGGVARLVVRGGVTLACVGTAIGLVGAAAGSRFLAGLLFGVGRADPVTYVVVPVAIIAGATLATWLPARRATRVAPTESLRAS